MIDAPKITDPLLVIHGMADDNVVLDNTRTALAAAMQAHAMPFEMMLYPGYPGQTHGIGGPKISVAPVHRVEQRVPPEFPRPSRCCRSPTPGGK